jgi:hypothetical protein
LIEAMFVIGSLTRHRPTARAIALYGRFAPSITTLARHPRVLTLSYRSLIDRPSETLGRAAEFLGLRDFDAAVPIRPFGKERYTGTTVNPDREVDPETLFDEATRSAIRRRYRRIYELLDRIQS